MTLSTETEIMKQEARAQTLFLYAISFLGQLSIAAINLSIIFYLIQRFGVGSQTVGLIAAIFSTAYFLGCVLLRDSISRIKPRHAVEAAALGMAVSGILVIVSESVLFVALSFGLYGFMMSLFWPPIMGWLSRGREGRALGRTIASFNLSWSSGIILGPFIAGLIAERDPTISMIGASGIMIAVFFMVVLVTYTIPSVRSAESNSRFTVGENPVDTSSNLRFLCWVGLFSSYFVFGIQMNIFPVHARMDLGFTESSIGLILLMRGLATTVVFLMLGRTIFWHDRKSLILGLQIGLTALMIVAGSLGRMSFGQSMAIFLIFGILFSWIYTNSIFHGASGSRDRQRRMAIHEAVLTAGMILGSLTGGIVDKIYSYASVMLLCAMIASLGLVIQLIMLMLFHAERKRTESVR